MMTKYDYILLILALPNIYGREYNRCMIYITGNIYLNMQGGCSSGKNTGFDTEAQSLGPAFHVLLDLDY